MIRATNLLTTLVAALVAFAGASCAAARAPGLPYVSKRVEERTGFKLARIEGHEEVTIPEGVSLSDGLSQDEAVMLALWNNAIFQVDLAALGFARADLIEAGLLRNPVLSLLFPVGPKQLEGTLRWGLDQLLQRPRRVAAARSHARAVAEGLVQRTLVLIADVKIAHAELALAQDRVRLAEQAREIQREIARIAEARLRAGDISELETLAAQSDADRLTADMQRIVQEAVVAQDRLGLMIGIIEGDADLEILPTWPPQSDPSACAKRPELVKEAFAARPDLRAAELAIESAAARLGWEQSRAFVLIGILDANNTPDGLQLGPGVETELPLFNRNEGGTARARAELVRATRAYVATRDSIALEVRDADARFVQARQALDTWRGAILPSLEEQARRAERTYAAGETSYLFVLEATRRLTDGRVREAEATADLRRAAARLDQSVGRTCAVT